MSEINSVRVRRGGSWYFFLRHAQRAIRFYDAPGERDSNLGIRLVEVVDV